MQESTGRFPRTGWRPSSWMEQVMVTREYMARSAVLWVGRRGTEMARAMLRALGIPYRERAPRIGVPIAEDRYTEIMECFGNAESPMDGRAFV